MKLILIEPDENLRSLFELNITNELSYEVISRDDAREAISFMQILPDIRIIVTKDKIGSENSAKILEDHLSQSGRSSVQLFVIGPEFEASQDFTHVLPENTTPEKLVEYLVKKRKVKGQSISTQGYMPVPLKSLKYLGVYPSDIYLNMKRDGELKFIKTFNAKDRIEKQDVEKYSLKGIEKVFVLESDFKDYVERANIVFSSMIINPDLSKKSKDELRKVVLRQIKNIGVNEQSLELASTFINDVQKEASSNAALGSIAEIFNSSMGYPFQRSYMCSLFSKLIADQYSWKDQSHIQALSIAAVFADSELSSKEEQAIATEDDLRDAQISSDRRKIVKTHAKLASEKVSQVKGTSPMLEQLVRFQHGNTTGESFNFNLGDKMSPLYAIFIVSDNLARLILSSTRKKIELNKYITEINKVYPNKHIETALENLKKLFV